MADQSGPVQAWKGRPVPQNSAHKSTDEKTQLNDTEMRSVTPATERNSSQSQESLSFVNLGKTYLRSQAETVQGHSGNFSLTPRIFTALQTEKWQGEALTQRVTEKHSSIPSCTLVNPFLNAQVN